MRRHTSAFALAALTLALPAAAAAQAAANAAAVTSPTTIRIRGVIELVSAAGDAFGAFADGVGKLVAKADTGWKVLSARRTHRRLTDLSAQLTKLGAIQATAVIPALENYLKGPSDASWAEVGRSTTTALTVVDAALEDLNNERGDLVFQPAYRKLQTALRARGAVLSTLVGTPPPSTAAEMAEVRVLLAKYRVLVAQLEAATEELNAYAIATAAR